MSEQRPSGVKLLQALESGEVRVAEPLPSSAAAGSAAAGWKVNAWVREGILDLFRDNKNVNLGSPDLREWFPFVDRENLGVRHFDVRSGVRLVPGGSSVRRGTFIASGVVLMPPMYVNVGAYVDANSMIDSHALVGSCAQIGKGVHVSAGAQIGGVLEPIGAQPVIVEDGAFVGGQVGIYEGVWVRAGAVLAAGLCLHRSSVIFDLVNQRELRAGADGVLEVPEGAVLIPGSRPAGAPGSWAQQMGLQQPCALLVKLRDDSTDAATVLESALRG